MVLYHIHIDSVTRVYIRTSMVVVNSIQDSKEYRPCIYNSSGALIIVAAVSCLKLHSDCLHIVASPIRARE